jgi:hypothetical protein
VDRRPWTRLRLLLALVAAAAPFAQACSAGGGAVGDDDDSALPGDDDDASSPPADDDSAGDDDSATDDDDASAPPPITAVTFAASFEGVAAGARGDDGWGASTEISGQFQFIYWTDLEQQDLHCRQRFEFSALARFGADQTGSCEGCAGQLGIGDVVALDPSAFEDGCGPLPPELDLSFLLLQADVSMPADFRSLGLLSVEQVLAVDWSLSVSGLSPQVLVDGYAALGLDVAFVALVPGGGWLTQDALLSEVAEGWADGAWFPMFAAYRASGDEGWGPTLVGSCFLGTLWTVRVGDGLQADKLPGQ